MAYRNKMSRKSSKRDFSKNGSRTHGKNLRDMPMRGGYRL